MSQTDAVRALDAYTETWAHPLRPGRISAQFLIADLVQLLIRSEKGDLNKVWATINTAVAQAEVEMFGETRS